MPTLPHHLKMFFCRVTAPLNEDLVENLPRYIKTKHYVHYFEEFYYVHENGAKTEKPHYHFLILCKTTKPEIQKWIKFNWNVVNYDVDDKLSGNAIFSVSDRYKPDSKDISLAYMLKGGINSLFENCTCKPGWVLTPFTEIYIDNDKYIELIEIYKTTLLKSIDKDKKQFEIKYDYIKDKLDKHNNHAYIKDDYIQLLKFIYHHLINYELQQRKIIKRYNLWDWSFTLCLHICTFKEKTKLIEKTIDEQIQKNLDIM
jgi:hypothetical protein